MGRVCVHDPKALGRLQQWMIAKNVTQFRTPDFDDADFFRLLAKVAHGYTVSKFGLQNFRPLLLPLIRGEQQDFPVLIGGPREPLSRKSASLWNLASSVKIVDGRPLAVVGFRLFGNFGAPAYEIVAGDFPGALVQSHPSGGAHVITYNDLCIGVLEGSPAFSDFGMPEGGWMIRLPNVSPTGDDSGELARWLGSEQPQLNSWHCEACDHNPHAISNLQEYTGAGSTPAASTSYY
jgi:hypothetical protein